MLLRFVPWLRAQLDLNHLAHLVNYLALHELGYLKKGATAGESEWVPDLKILSRRCATDL